MAKTSGPFAAPAVQRESERVKETTPPLWEIRGPEEAGEFWSREYPHLFPEEDRGADGAAPDADRDGGGGERASSRD